MILDGHHKKRIIVLHDGRSDTPASIAQAHALSDFITNELDHQSIDVLVNSDGDWLAFGSVYEPAKLLQTVDAALLSLAPTSTHTISVLRALDTHAVPYVGAQTLATAIATNRVLTKDHLRDYQVRLAPHMQLNKDNISNVHQAAASVTAMFGGPYVIRPVQAVSDARFEAPHTEAVSAALNALFQDYDGVLVEKYITGTPASCVVVDGLRAEKRYTLPVTEEVAKNEYRAPGRFSDTVKKDIKSVALLVHEVLGLRHHSESYFVVSGEHAYFTRVNPNPVWSPHSSAGVAAEAVGLHETEYNRHLISHLQLDHV